ncbi:putative leader peptide [Rhodococcus sp. RD6.2]|uniref:putative leader peptide n=1 Tax=Rhodococcus sp. RD6.2 TaxID=260936 RepID=UPI0034606807
MTAWSRLHIDLCRVSADFCHLSTALGSNSLPLPQIMEPRCPSRSLPRLRGDAQRSQSSHRLPSPPD